MGSTTKAPPDLDSAEEGKAQVTPRTSSTLPPVPVTLRCRKLNYYVKKTKRGPPSRILCNVDVNFHEGNLTAILGRVGQSSSDDDTHSIAPASHASVVCLSLSFFCLPTCPLSLPLFSGVCGVGWASLGAMCVPGAWMSACGWVLDPCPVCL